MIENVRQLQAAVRNGVAAYLTCPGPITLSVRVHDVEAVNEQELPRPIAFISEDYVKVLIDNFGNLEWILTATDYIKLPVAEFIIIKHPKLEGKFGVRKKYRKSGPNRLDHEGKVFSNESNAHMYDWMNQFGVWGAWTEMRTFDSEEAALRHLVNQQPNEGEIIL